MPIVALGLILARAGNNGHSSDDPGGLRGENEATPEGYEGESERSGPRSSDTQASQEGRRKRGTSAPQRHRGEEEMNTGGGGGRRRSPLKEVSSLVHLSLRSHAISVISQF